MKVATIAYDKRGVIAVPKKIYQNPGCPEAALFTTDGGYWHTVAKLFFNKEQCQREFVNALEKIESLNGTATMARCNEDLINTNGRTVHQYVLIYAMEEPDHVPFRRFAATIDKLGVDPAFVHPYDGVAEHGPGYHTAPQHKLAYLALDPSLTYPEPAEIPAAY